MKNAQAYPPVYAGKIFYLLAVKNRNLPGNHAEDLNPDARMNSIKIYFIADLLAHFVNKLMYFPLIYVMRKHKPYFSRLMPPLVKWHHFI